MGLESVFIFQRRSGVRGKQKALQRLFIVHTVPNLCKLSNVGGLTKIRQKPCQVKNELFYTFFISSE